MAGATLRCQVSVSSCDHLGERRREVFIKGIVVLKQFPAFNYLWNEAFRSATFECLKFYVLGWNLASLKIP